jgi:hypothetical protein
VERKVILVRKNRTRRWDALRPLTVAVIALAVLVTLVSLWEIWHAEIAVP